MTVATKRIGILAILLALVLAGCETTQPGKKATIGGLGGAAAGGLLAAGGPMGLVLLTVDGNCLLILAAILPVCRLVRMRRCNRPGMVIVRVMPGYTLP